MRTCLVVVVVLSPSCVLGQTWEPPFDFGNPPILPVHLVHVYDRRDESAPLGKLMATSNDYPGGCWAGWTQLWTPGTGAFETVALCRNELFCEGHSALSDGRILFVGGTYVSEANLFDPRRTPLPVWGDGSVNQWNRPAMPPNMASRRWYPTATTLGDGKVLVTSGLSDQGCGNPPCNPPIPPTYSTIPELYTPSTNSWTSLPNAARQQYLYPFMFVLPDGNLVYAGPWESRILVSSTDPLGWRWGTVELGVPTEPPWRPGFDSSAVMYEPGKVMRCGGYVPIEGYPLAAATQVVNLNFADPDAPPAWMNAADMVKPRRHHNLVILPDGRVLAVGGNQVGETEVPVYEAEIYDPKTNTWTLQPPSDTQNPRGYHSSAQLLPDGRVISAGGNVFRTAQIFRPKYITAAPRPHITSAPLYMQYGGTYTISYQDNGAGKAGYVSLIRLGATTHGFDQDQRRVPLEVVGLTAATVTVHAPLNGNRAPPGYYMLFILSEYEVNQFSPCDMAAYVQVGP